MFECTRITAKVYSDQSGIYYEMPVLLTADGHLDILLDYLIEHWDSRSPAWMVKVTSSVQLFLEYFTAHENYVDEQRVFQTFRHRLLTGTIAGGYAADPTGLWWSARSPKLVNRIVRNLSDFFNWWSIKNPWKKNPAATWKGSQYDVSLAEAAYTYRRNKAFLGHTWSVTGDVSRRPGNGAVPGKFLAGPKTERQEAPAFPENRILDLLFDGFKVANRFNYRDMLITLLLNGAGFRESEPFHLYLWDVMEDPACKGSALVLIHHPAWGDAPKDSTWLDTAGRARRGRRVEYLAERFGLAPRDWGLSTSAAGWKGGMHESTHGGFYKQAYWFVPEFGKMFWEIWNIYVEQVMRIDPSKRSHPYAFMNVMRDPIGALYKLGKFQDSHAAAVRRIGLVPAKHLGTSDHGHRHAYGQRLRKAGVPNEMIRRFMHHTDLGSQEVYTEAGREECLDHIRLAVERLNALQSDGRTNIVRVNPSDFARIAMPLS
jgi:hypothetical protein